MNCLKPGIKKGFLTDREKFIIKEAKIKNLPPSIVSMNLTNRTPAQVRNAYRRIVLYDEDIYRGGWTADEDNMLLDAVNSHASYETWSQLSQQVPGRNGEQCRHRFKLIEKKIKLNPKLTVDDFPRPFRPFNPKELTFFPEDELNEGDLHEKFKHNRQLLKTCNVPIETFADRKLKKSYLENKFVIANCNLSSKCDLYRHVLDYLGAKLIVPETFAHKDDLIDDGLMSMMTYISESRLEVMTLDPSNVEHDLCDPILTHDGVHDVLRTSDITNSDLSEIEGLLDIRMRNIQKEQPIEGINTKNSIKNKKDLLLPLNFIGSVPPNHETFKMLYTYTNSLNSCMKINHFKNPNIHFDWDDEESKKLHKRLVAIFRLPALFSSLIPHNTANINMIVNTEEVNMVPSSNYSRIHYTCSKKSNFNLKKIL